MKKIPQLRLLVTNKCDFACVWCHSGGEGGGKDFKPPSFELNTEQIKKLTSALVDEGISNVKISGGDPLERNDIAQIISKIRLIERVKNVQLVTKSPKLKMYADSLANQGLNELTVSIDTLNKEKFKLATGCKFANSLEDIIEGIKKIRLKGIPTKLNVIPQKKFNDDELINITQFAAEYELSLKFIDLMSLNKIWWKERFMAMSDVERILKPMITHIYTANFQPGRLGTPMKHFLLKNGVNVFLRDATSGTHYGRICESCKNFPCQDGLMALRLTSDGKLKFCLYRNDNLVDLLSVSESGEDIRQTIMDVINVFKSAKFQRCWSPEIELSRIYKKEG